MGTKQPKDCLDFLLFREKNMLAKDCETTLVNFNDYSVPSTSERLHADSNMRGRGVTIAFLDSGFYPHPDLGDRIAAYIDLGEETQDLNPHANRNGWNWHGMMTSVSACGDGSLSGGRYRGLASEAKVVLIKCSRNGMICDDLILKGLHWVRDNAAKYHINILNISVGSDFDPKELNCEISQASEELVSNGILVIAAAGNTRTLPRPPANAPSVLTVGGCVSRNACTPEEAELYCSSYGVILDLVVKPEIIAPAAWVAAPILPGTVQYKRAQYCYDLAVTSGGPLLNLLSEVPEGVGLPDNLYQLSREELTKKLDKWLLDDKVVGRHYQHVDGTSFAAPTVAAIAAQMLEANPQLTPAAIRQIFMSTADRVNGKDLLAQGCGIVNASRAVEQAHEAWTHDQICELRPPLVLDGKLSFIFVNYFAKKVELMGDFNDWTPHQYYFHEMFDGTWKVEIDAPPPGRYRYKFRVDEKDWFEDPANLYRKPNVWGSYDSILNIA